MYFKRYRHAKASGYYEDLAERMVGDLDILIPNQLITKNNY